MEEVDNIILQTLHQLGMTFPEEVTTLNELPENYVLLSTKKCLDKILGNEGEPDIPEETSQKIILANDIISHFKKLGYKGKLGYELLLYPNETDTRKILSFIIDKLPKESEKAYLYLMRDNFSLLMQNICQKISEELNSPWAPSYCKMKGFNVTPDGTWTRSGCSFIDPFDRIPFQPQHDDSNIIESFENYWNKNISLSVETVSNEIDSNESETQANEIIEKLILAKGKNNMFIKESELLNNDFNYSHEVHQNEIANLTSKDIVKLLTKSEEDNKKIIKQIDEHKTKSEMISNDLASEKLKESTIQSKIETLSLVTSLLPDIEVNMEKLQLIHEKETNKLNVLKKEIANLEIKSSKDNEILEKQKIKHSKYSNTIKSLESRVKRLSDEHHKQATLKIQLQRDCSKRQLKKKYIKKRSAYTKRIMEIIGNISKQKLEINKILSDTRTLQKEMNNMNGRLERSFTVVDELVFKDAKRDEHARKTYKLIAHIHTGCGEIVNKVNEIGSNLREIRDLEKHVETEKKKNITENLQRVYCDLKFVQSQKNNVSNE